MLSHWAHNWKEVEGKSIIGGNQGKARIVTKINDPELNKYFLKELSEEDNQISERRKRMFREVNCFRTLNHPNIPKSWMTMLLIFVINQFPSIL